MLKLDTLTRLDAIDPLPKLGRKVGAKKPDEGRALRLELSRFECDRCPIDDLDATTISTFNNGRIYGESLTEYAGSFPKLAQMYAEAMLMSRQRRDGMYKAGYFEQKAKEAAPQPKPSLDDGWIEWAHGAECTLDCAVPVDIKRRGGATVMAVPPLCVRWEHIGNHTDIIAYRIHKRPEVANPHMDDLGAYAAALNALT